MAATMLSRKAAVPTCRQAPSSRRVVVCAAQLPEHRPSPLQMAGQAVAAFAMGVSLVAAPPAMAEITTLGSVMAKEFGFVDANQDGLVTKDELKQISAQVAEAEDFDVPREEVIDFTAKLFDLNQDGKLTTEELLTGLALDSVVGDGGIDADAVKLFDRNNDGRVDMAEWKAGFPPLAPGGEQTKEYVFRRVDWLQGSDGKLSTTDGLGNALTLSRILILGY